jgi:hypothetical protein
MVGWWPRAGAYNYVQNGDFENALLAALTPWSVAGATAMNNFSTSITRITTASKFGQCSGRIVSPGGQASEGVNYRIFRRFKKGITYTAEAWVHSAAQVTNISMKMGNGAASDTASGSGVALSTAWQRITVTWTPTADRDDAHVALILGSITATTFEIDGVMVYEGTVAPTSPNQTEGRGGFPPFGVIEAENLVGGTLSNEQQLVVYGAGDGTTPAFTLTYSAQTTASIDLTGLSNAAAAALVVTRLEALSNIAVGDVAVIADTANNPKSFIVTFQGALANTNVAQMTGSGIVVVTTLVQGGLNPTLADANYRSGWSAIPGSAGSGLPYIARVVIDPALLVPDDYTQNEIAIEVWGRQTTLPQAQAIKMAAWPITATAVAPAVTTEEYGTAGKTTIPSSSGTPLRFMRLGTLRLRTDMGRYLLTWESPTGGAQLDYFVLVPSNWRALGPTAKPLDANYPAFVPATSEITKRIRPDLSATIKEPASGTPEVNAPGLGGSLLEMLPGNNDVVVKLSNLVPDDPTVGTSAEQLAHSATVHFKITPRWRLGR